MRTSIGCGEVRGRLAAVTGDELSDAVLATHVRACPACAAEWALVRALRAGRPVAPAGLQESILARVGPLGASRPATEVPEPRIHGWRVGALAAAALAVVVAAAVMVRQAEPTDEAAELVAAAGTELDAPALAEWPGGDGLLAGAPVLAELTEAELEALLEEMES